ncbi:hypothetical protein LTR16_001037 [Cryomyces antarcticus]|uniref:DUF7924 domain-containing protein n=1 Tax=Cryomyces antarcticus TaxID=329879 RepID=A0ABR0KU81_9PEZI|nr:hypothetical protein LTR39_000652 [Cryomyces antarcticus]KAK5131116.1 hypothetical protein LTR16_001037 [Cryomyces antarcticus]
MDHLLARKKSSSTLSSKKTDTTSDASNVTTSKTDRSARYRSRDYEVELEKKSNSFMDESDRGITDASESICRKLLEEPQTVPQDSLFDDDIFVQTRKMIRDRNEAKSARLIVPSAEGLAVRAKHLGILIESVNESWSNCISVTQPRPQPDYAVGFKKTAFTAEQLKIMAPYVGGNKHDSHFMATSDMYFPFLTCEVKRGNKTLDVAERQNAHSMIVAVRGVVELFKRVKREQEVDREILAFSVAHDHESVKIFGHYAVIGEEPAFYRKLVCQRYFTEPSGRDKWTAYKFTRNVYDNWMPSHINKVRSAVDELLKYDVPQPSDEANRIGELRPSAEPAPLVEERRNGQDSSTSLGVEAVDQLVPPPPGDSRPLDKPKDHQHLLARNADSASEHDSRHDLGDARPITPDTSPSEGSPARGPSKRRSSTLKKEENKRPRPSLNGVFDGQVDQGNGSLALPS